LDSGPPVNIATWNSVLAVILFPYRIATAAMGVLGLIGDAASGIERLL
jgi:hypothetical protein